jgi:hypothetical protein
LLIDEISNLIAVEILVIAERVCGCISENSHGFRGSVRRSATDLKIGWRRGQIVFRLLPVCILSLRSRCLKQCRILLTASPSAPATRTARGKWNRLLHRRVRRLRLRRA